MLLLLCRGTAAFKCSDAPSSNHLRSNIRPGLLHRLADCGHSAQVDGRCSRSSNRRRSSEHPCLGSSSFPKRKSTRNHHVRHGQRLGSSSSNGSRVLVCQALSEQAEHISVAQQAVQRPPKPKVEGSIPSRDATLPSPQTISRHGLVERSKAAGCKPACASTRRFESGSRVHSSHRP